MSFQVKASLEGDAALLKALRKAAKDYPGALARALYAEGFAVQGDAVRLAPVEFGVLRTSAYTSPPTGPSAVVEVGFGTDYAVYQHEKTELRHPRGGQAKYLETATNERSATMLGSLAERTRANVLSGETSEAIAPVGPTRPKVGRIVRKRSVLAMRRSRKRRSR